MKLMSALAIFLGLTANALATEIVIKDTDSKNLDITIYNKNLALVKDVRNVNLQKGENDIAFEGVSSAIKPESAILYAQGIKVLEQNYDYDILDLNNIIEKSVGKNVKTIKINPSNGEKIFDTAKILSFVNGTPILEFSYGIDANFDGQLLFEDLPAGLRRKPTLVAKIKSDTANSNNISLAYLTNGINWKTNYVANVIDNTKLNLTAWVTINNESGIDYNNANVQLVAGEVNQTYENSAPRRNGMVMMAAATSKMAMADGVVQEDISAYHLYTLPNKTTIKDKQTKQISLMERNSVKYKKEAELNSLLHFYPDSNSEFKNQHLAMYYTINNDENSNLGVPLPEGIIRFYENDAQKNMQFIGENRISHVAKGETMRLNLGNYSNIFANGKINKINKLPEEKQVNTSPNCVKYLNFYTYDAEIEVFNSSKNPQEISIKQNFPQDAEVIEQNIKGKNDQANIYQWIFNVPADNKQRLTFKVKIPSIIKEDCHR
ncbi:MAG: DUF4139 domain-containing protein [Alphaproteobacteria bacterium]|nr:DUF4139 domain-containing protein [Alphaproteobacteria bacterium]